MAHLPSIAIQQDRKDPPIASQLREWEHNGPGSTRSTYIRIQKGGKITLDPPATVHGLWMPLVMLWHDENINQEP